MHERERTMIENDAYWSHDLLLGEAPVGDALSLVRGKVHVADEAYQDHHALYALPRAQGERTYIRVRSYMMLEPAATLTVDLYSPSDTSSAIGAVTDATWTGPQHRRLGAALFTLCLQQVQAHPGHLLHWTP
jgi:hypothetical protein